MFNALIWSDSQMNATDLDALDWIFKKKKKKAKINAVENEI